MMTLEFGMYVTSQINLDYDGEEESRVLLLVHDTKPPFLEGKVWSNHASHTLAAGHVRPLH